MTATRPPMLAADHIRQLVKHTVVTERVPRFVPIPNVGELPAWDRIKKTATITYEPLLTQLEHAASHGSKTGAYTSGAAGSRPAARLEAVATLQRIDKQSKKRAAELELPNAPLVDRLLAISGKVGSTEDKEIRAWWVAARCATGWEQAPYEPDVPCPNTECERRGTLRIRLDAYIATCTSCGETWDDENYTQLGDYVRWAFEHLRGAKHWLYDSEGYPTDCLECLVERQMMAERIVERKRSKDDTQAVAG